MTNENATVSGASSLERLVPDEIKQGESTGVDTLQLHMARYEWAASLIAREKQVHRILDAACGVGYGSAILAASKPDVQTVGVDIDAAAVSYATQRYGKSSIQFLHSDVTKLQGLPEFDAIVSLETIEHVADPVQAINQFWKLLRPGGLFIMSVPVTPSVDVNPFHLTDFSAASIRKILTTANFEIVEEFPQIQSFNPIRILTKQESRVEDMRPNLVSYYLKNPSACVKRAYATLRFGFTNRYLTLACRKQQPA